MCRSSSSRSGERGPQPSVSQSIGQADTHWQAGKIEHWQRSISKRAKAEKEPSARARWKAGNLCGSSSFICTDSPGDLLLLPLTLSLSAATVGAVFSHFKSCWLAAIPKAARSTSQSQILSTGGGSGGWHSSLLLSVILAPLEVQTKFPRCLSHSKLVCLCLLNQRYYCLLDDDPSSGSNPSSASSVVRCTLWRPVSSPFVCAVSSRLFRSQTTALEAHFFSFSTTLPHSRRLP